MIPNRGETIRTSLKKLAKSQKKLEQLKRLENFSEPRGDDQKKLEQLEKQKKMKSLKITPNRGGTIRKILKKLAKRQKKLEKMRRLGNYSEPRGDDQNKLEKT